MLATKKYQRKQHKHTYHKIISLPYPRDADVSTMLNEDDSASYPHFNTKCPYKIFLYKEEYACYQFMFIQWDTPNLQSIGAFVIYDKVLNEYSKDVYQVSAARLHTLINLDIYADNIYRRFKFKLIKQTAEDYLTSLLNGI